MSLDADIHARLELALDAARQAGEFTLGYFLRDDLQVELKADESPVTAADRGAEQLLRKLIGAEFPRDELVGEEFPTRSGASGFRWIFDPIDGTKSFIHGVPLYGCLIGLEFESRPVAGVVRIPALDECVYASVGHGAWHVVKGAAPKPARVSRVPTLDQALFCTSEVKNFIQRGLLPAYQRLEAATRLTRTWGDCYGYLLVATGRAEVMVDPLMNVWDAAPLLPILVEAGGTFTDWQGNPTINAGEGVATNGLVLDAALAALRS